MLSIKHLPGSFWGFVLIACIWIVPVANAQNVVRGVVFDSSTGEPLSAAHVKVVELSTGAITNARGTFVLSLATLPATLSVQYIGFQSQRIEIVEIGADLRIGMVHTIYDLPEIEVSTEDLARRIMREVIATKIRNRDRVRKYRRDGYVRLSLARDGEIQVITQHLFSDYHHTSYGERTVARASSETSDIYRLLNIDPLGQRIDLNNDTVLINNLRFIGPTHPDALNKYHFVLDGRRQIDDQLVYDIFVSPRTHADATFTGRLSVLDSAFVMIDARLRPSRHVTFAHPIKQWDVFYEQQYSRIADSVWLPVDLRAEGRIHVDPDDQGYEQAELGLVSQLSSYILNEAVRDTLVFELSDRVILDSAFVLTELPFLPNGNMIPLTPRETDALGGLMQKQMTIEDAFLEKPAFSRFARFERQRNATDDESVAWPVIYGYQPWLRFNRVDGFFLGAGRSLTFSPELKVDIRAAQATGFERIRFLGRAAYRSGQRLTITGSYVADTNPATIRSKYPVSLSSVSSLIGQPDYFDHYWSKRLTGKIDYALERFRFSATASTDRASSVETAVKKIWPYNRSFRSNPEIVDGRNNSLMAIISVGEATGDFRLDPINQLSVSIEHSNKDIFQSDYTYTNVNIRAETIINTFFRKRPLPATTRVRLEATASLDGGMDFQKPVLDGTIASFAVFGSLRSLRNQYYDNSRMVSVFWEHSLGTVPFELTGLSSLRRITSGLRIHGGHTRLSDNNNFRLSDPLTGQHHEMGLGLASIFGIPLRVDVTFRLDRPGTYFTVGVERLWKN